MKKTNKRAYIRPLSKLTEQEREVDTNRLAVNMLTAKVLALASDRLMEACYPALYRRNEKEIIKQMEFTHEQRAKQFVAFERGLKRAGIHDDFTEDVDNLLYLLYAQVHRALYKDKYDAQGVLFPEWAHEVDPEQIADSIKHLISDKWTTSELDPIPQAE